MSNSDNPEWKKVVDARRKALTDPEFTRIGSNRVPEDDPSYGESEHAVDNRISFIVANSMM